MTPTHKERVRRGHPRPDAQEIGIMARELALVTTLPRRATDLSSLQELHARLTDWLADHGVLLLRLGMGIVYFWFGLLKFFPGASPAEDLAARTIAQMTFGL